MTDTVEHNMNSDGNDDSSYIGTQFSTLLNTMSQLKNQIVIITNQLRTLEKVVNKEVKTYKKERTKKKLKDIKKPSGFAAASPISNDLCKFMGKEIGTNIARTEVTKFICSYIKEKALTDDNNNKVIKPDDKLKDLLGTDDNTVLTYFNIQRFMNKHFIKNTNQNNEK